MNRNHHRHHRPYGRFSSRLPSLVRAVGVSDQTDERYRRAALNPGPSWWWRLRGGVS